MSQDQEKPQKVYVLGTTQPGLNANFRKVGFCGSMNTPTETKAVLDMLDTESWAIPYNHIFYRQGVDEQNPPSDLDMQSEDVIGEFIGGILTENGDTVMLAELDPSNATVEKIITEVEAYKERIAEQIKAGVPKEELEKPPFGFSPHAKLAFDPSDGVVAKDFKNISLVDDPEYGPEGAYMHAMSSDKKKIMQHIADEYLSNDAYVSPKFGDELWTLHKNTRPPKDYVPKVMIPVEDPMDDGTKSPATVGDDEKPTVSDTQEHIETENPPASVSVMSSREKSNLPQQATETHTNAHADAVPQKSNEKSTSTNNQNADGSFPPGSSHGSDPAPEPTTQINDPMEGVESTSQGQSHAESQSQQPEPQQPPQPPLGSNSSPSNSGLPRSNAQVTERDAKMQEANDPPQSAQSRENQHSQSANAGNDYYRRAQEEAEKKQVRKQMLDSIKSDAERINMMARNLEPKLSAPGQTEFNDISLLLSAHQSLMSKLRESDIRSFEAPMEVNSAIANTQEMFKKWKTSTVETAKEYNMEEELPTNLDDMITDGNVLQSNQRVLQVFSKAMRVGQSRDETNRMNQRKLEEEAERIRKEKVASSSLKRPRESPESTEDADPPAKRKEVEVFNPVKSRIMATHKSNILDCIVFSSRLRPSAEFHVPRPDSGRQTAELNAIKKRWCALAVNNL
jgi:hypothetical protein